ncbi:hypothetical protein PR048_001391 [Dryococelus australis]|uniref:Uncharacterized protein n=1 Tax=Dryococelus australis TaxID=614101 RepID=A0ABQ9IIP6_9NEOP|nr:hypothetical protein PR048_001391 [Dryococelus australis]
MVNITRLPPSQTGLDSRNFARGNRAVRCRWSAGFVGNLLLPPLLHSGAAPYSAHFTLIRLSRPRCSDPPKSIQSYPRKAIKILVIRASSNYVRRTLNIMLNIAVHLPPPSTVELHCDTADMAPAFENALFPLPLPALCKNRRFERGVLAGRRGVGGRQAGVAAAGAWLGRTPLLLPMISVLQSFQPLMTSLADYMVIVDECTPTGSCSTKLVEESTLFHCALQLLKWRCLHNTNTSLKTLYKEDSLESLRLDAEKQINICRPILFHVVHRSSIKMAVLAHLVAGCGTREPNQLIKVPAHKTFPKFSSLPVENSRTHHPMPPAAIWAASIPIRVRHNTYPVANLIWHNPAFPEGSSLQSPARRPYWQSVPVLHNPEEFTLCGGDLRNVAELCRIEAFLEDNWRPAEDVENFGGQHLTGGGASRPTLDKPPPQTANCPPDCAVLVLAAKMAAWWGFVVRTPKGEGQYWLGRHHGRTSVCGRHFGSALLVVVIAYANFNQSWLPTAFIPAGYQNGRCRRMCSLGKKYYQTLVNFMERRIDTADDDADRGIMFVEVKGETSYFIFVNIIKYASVERSLMRIKVVLKEFLQNLIYKKTMTGLALTSAELSVVRDLYSGGVIDNFAEMFCTAPLIKYPAAETPNTSGIPVFGAPPSQRPFTRVAGGEAPKILVV